jgi:hypothetical protein
MKIIIRENQFKRIILKEDIMDCPTGFVYDKEVDNCVEVQELDEVTILSFENDVDGSISESYRKYVHRLKQLEEIYEEEGGVREISPAFYYKNLKKPMGGYNVEFFDNLYHIVNNEYVNRYKTFERYRRESFIEDKVRPMVGKPYVWGEMGPEFFDCSGLICHVFERGWKHNAQMLYDKSNLFYSIDDVKVGDIAYFDYDPDNLYDEINNPDGDKKPIDHVGIISKKEGNKLWLIHASGKSTCTVERYEKKKNKYGKKIKPIKCVVKEERFNNYWKNNVAAFGRLKDYNF